MRTAAEAGLAGLLHDVVGGCHTVLGYADVLHDGAESEGQRRAAAAILATARGMSAIAVAHQALAGPPRTATDAIPIDRAMRAALDQLAPVLGDRDASVEITSHLDDALVAPREVLEPTAALLAAWASTGTGRGGSIRVTVDREDRAGSSIVEIRTALADGSPPALGSGRRYLELAEQLAAHQGAHLGAEAPGHVAWHLPVVREAIVCQQPSQARGRRSILHVEDDAASRELLAMAVEEVEWDIVGVDDVAQAEERVSTSSFDVVVVDHHLGDQVGLDLLRRLRAAEGPGLGLVLTTGDRDRTLAEHALGLGVEVVYKPVDVEQLLHVLAGAPRSP